MFLKVHHWTLCLDILAQFAHSHSISVRFILIFSHLCLDLPSESFLKVFLPNICAFLVSSMHAMCLAHHILFNLITEKIFGEGYKLLSSSLYSSLPPCITFHYTMIF